MPPLLRGVGTSVILFATVLSFAAAREDPRAGLGGRPPASRPAATAATQPSPSAWPPEIAGEIAELRREIADDSVLEEVVENPWFEVGGFAGTACIAASFFVEHALRRRRKVEASAGPARGVDPA